MFMFLGTLFDIELQIFDIELMVLYRFILYFLVQVLAISPQNPYLMRPLI